MLPTRTSTQPPGPSLQPQRHRAAAAPLPLRPPPIQTSLNGGSLRGTVGFSKYYGSSQSPLSLAREARYKATQQMTTTTPCPAPARADPRSVPCSPTVSICGASSSVPPLPHYGEDARFCRISTDEIMPTSEVGGFQMQLSSTSPVSPATSSCPSSLPSPGSSVACNHPSLLEESEHSVQRWRASQHQYDNDQSYHRKKSSASHKIRVRGRAFSESATGLASRVSQWKNLPLSRRGAKQRMGKFTDVLDPILDCASEKEQEADDTLRGVTSTWDIVASRHALGSTSHDQKRSCESAKEAKISTGEVDADLRTLRFSFSVLRGQSEGRFTMTQGDIDGLQYSDLEDQCNRALPRSDDTKGAHSIARGDRIFIVLSSAEAMRLRLIKSESTLPSCNLAIIEPWTTSISMTMQELLIKECFRDICRKEDRVRLFVLERGQSLPCHISASKDFWSGWSSISATKEEHKSMSILIQSGAAPVVPSDSISRKSVSLRVSSPTSRTSLSVRTSLLSQSPPTTIGTKEDDSAPIEIAEIGGSQTEEQGESERSPNQQSPSDSLLPLQASHFSSESNSDERGKEAVWNSKVVQLPSKRRKRGVRIPILNGTALALRAGNVSCFKSDAISPRVTSVLLQTRRERRVSTHPNVASRPKVTSPVWRKKRHDMMVETASPFNTARNGLGGSFRCSNRALRRAAGYFGGRGTLSLQSSQPPTPTTASISLAEMCSNLPESSVENLLCQMPKTEDESGDWRDTLASFTVDQEEKEIIGGGQSSEMASMSSKRRGWVGNVDFVPSIRESCELEVEAQEIEIRPEKVRVTINLDDNYSKKALVEELAEDQYEPPKVEPRRAGSITSLFKATMSTLASAPSPRKHLRAGGRLRKHIDSFTRSKSGGKSSELNEKPGDERRSAEVASMSAYSMSSIDCAEAMPLTGATTADSSPCLTDASPIVQLTPPDGKHLTRPASSSRLFDTSPRPPRKRESGMFQVHSMASHGSLYRSQSLSMLSEGWMCSNEDLEPEVRDCVSRLSGRKKESRLVHLERLNVKNLDAARLKEEQINDSSSIDSIATTVLSSRCMSPGSAPLLQQCSSRDRLRLLSNSSSNAPAAAQVSPIRDEKPTAIATACL